MIDSDGDHISAGFVGRGGVIAAPLSPPSIGLQRQSSGSSFSESSMSGREETRRERQTDLLFEALFGGTLNYRCCRRVFQGFCYILKTIQNPLQPNPISLPEQNLFEPVQHHAEDLEDLDRSIYTFTGLLSEDEKTVLSVHAPSALSSRTVFQRALSFVRNFSFQAVCAVWVYGFSR